MPDDLSLIDTNIIVHAFVLLDESKHEKAKSLLLPIWIEGGGVTTMQNVCEFYSVTTKQLKNCMPVEKAGHVVDRLL